MLFLLDYQNITSKRKNFKKNVQHIEKCCIFALAKRNGLVAQLDRVPDYGSGGCGFDSRLVHMKKGVGKAPFLFKTSYLHFNHYANSGAFYVN